MSDTPLTVEGVDFFHLPTRDFAAATDFYENVLGLPRTAVYGKHPGGEFETGNLTLQIMESEAFGMRFEPSPNPIALRVADVEAARSALEDRGVEFAHETIDSGVCHMAVFRDPDGNALMLHQRYAPEPG